jgi:hypothetical protein
MRRVLAASVLVFLLVTAGCFGPGVVAVDPSITVTAAGEGERVTVSVSSEADQEYTFREFQVVGLGPDDDPVCTARFDDLRADGGRGTETVTCDRVPLAFVVRLRNTSETLTPDNVVVYASPDPLVLVNATTSGTTYEAVDEDRLSAGPVAYAKCVLQRDGFDPTVFDGDGGGGDGDNDTSWLAWERLEPNATTTYAVAAGNKTGYPVRASAGGGRELEPIDLPSNPGTEPLRALLDEARSEEASPGGALGYDRSLTRAELLALFDALHDREVTGFDDVPAASGSPAYAAGARFDTRRIDCTRRATGAYTGADSVSVEYALRYDGTLYMVRARAVTSWSGPAFGTPGQ